MPKKIGVNKTFSFSTDVVEKLKWLCKNEMRTQTNMIELLIVERWNEKKRGGE